MKKTAIATEVSAERKRLHDLFMHAPACIAVISGPDLVFEFANPPYRQLVGAEHKLEGKTLLEAVPDLEPALLKIVKNVATKGERFVNNEIPVVLDWDKNGTPYAKYLNLIYEPLFDRHKKPDGLMCFANDVTEQVLARQRAVDSEQQLRFMAESMPQMIFTVLPNGDVGYFNSQWETYTGISTDSLLSDASLQQELIHPDDLGGAAKALKRAFKTGKPLEHEYRLRRKDGAYRWHISRINPMKNKKGKIMMWVGSNTDIDDIKMAIERRHELEIRTAALTEQRAQLLLLNQAKDEFISLASHQLRTPATGVKQYLGMLMEGYAGPVSSDQRMFLQTAYESNERQITIVNDLLQVARIDAGKVKIHKKPTDIVRLTKNVLNEQASRFAERGQKVVFVSKASKVTVKIDAERIRMVLDNIIDNAGKYTEAGKPIRVTVSGGKKSVSVAVKDQGVGMDEANIEKIFEKFSRLYNPLSDAAEGSGLGLYWAKKIVDLHQGRIDVKSSVGQGTTFTVRLPL